MKTSVVNKVRGESFQSRKSSRGDTTPIAWVINITELLTIARSSSSYRSKKTLLPDAKRLHVSTEITPTISVRMLFETAKSRKGSKQIRDLSTKKTYF